MTLRNIKQKKIKNKGKLSHQREAKMENCILPSNKFRKTDHPDHLSNKNRSKTFKAY